jgi:hypothetical protein
MDVLDIGPTLAYIGQVKKFVATARKHSLSAKWLGCIICPCSHYKNKLAHEDSMVQSHLGRFGFV